MKTNITLKLDRDLLRKIRVLAAEKDTSVSGLLAEQLEKAVRERDGYERVHAAEGETENLCGVAGECAGQLRRRASSESRVVDLNTLAVCDRQSQLAERFAPPTSEPDRSEVRLCERVGVGEGMGQRSRNLRQRLAVTLRESCSESARSRDRDPDHHKRGTKRHGHTAQALLEFFVVDRVTPRPDLRDLPLPHEHVLAMDALEGVAAWHPGKEDSCDR